MKDESKKKTADEEAKPGEIRGRDRNWFVRRGKDHEIFRDGPQTRGDATRPQTVAQLRSPTITPDDEPSTFGIPQALVMEVDPPPRPAKDSPVPIRTAHVSMPQTQATDADLRGDEYYTRLASKHWGVDVKTPKVQPKVLKTDLWARLERDHFEHGALVTLENAQIVERYLWPGYDEKASNFHVLLLAIFVNVKRREGSPAWDLFTDQPDDFASFFHRVLALSLDHSLSMKVRTFLLQFLVGAFQSTDNGLVRKECAPLVSVAIWHNLHSERFREVKLDGNAMVRRAWKASNRRFDAADEEAKSRLLFERSWLYTLALELIDALYDNEPEQAGDRILFCERVMELLIDLLGQPPTRRYVNSLLKDVHVLSAVRLSHAFQEEPNGLLRELHSLLEHFLDFPVDDYTSHARSAAEQHSIHYRALSKLQQIAIRHFDNKLKILALANYSSLQNSQDLSSHLDALDDNELRQLCDHLDLRTLYPANSLLVLDRAFYTEIIISTHAKQPWYQDLVRSLPIMPTEKTLYEHSFLRTEFYNGSRPLALPKLNLQYLTIGDFLWRAFVLQRSESFHGIRKHVEDTIKRVQPRSDGLDVRFDGFSRMAIPIPKPTVQDVAITAVGEEIPSQVRAEIILDVSRLAPQLQREWDSLRPDDVVYLAAVHPPAPDARPLTNGAEELDTAQRLGLRCLRVAQVLQVQDENGRPVREHAGDQMNGYSRRIRQRRLIVKLDPVAYQRDLDEAAPGKPNPIDSLNLIIRRRGRENNFKPILESIRQLALSDVPAPEWLQDVFLGIGDPAGANYKRLPNRLQSVDFRDTFLNWQHLIEALPGRVVEPHEDSDGSFGPPYVLKIHQQAVEEAPPPSKKRRRDQAEPPAQGLETVEVSTYKPPSIGPYPSDVPRTNTVRFTDAQVEAIASGTQPGLTVIVGPPGTGKTDVATQIINNLYHNFPQQRTLLIAHGNQALNQLFQKIAALDIDERHLLRLGHGEEELETEVNYSKAGRVESFLELGARYLAEVQRLAASIAAPGDHGGSCETASYFNSVYITPLWGRYWDAAESEDSDVHQVIETFPFFNYFSNAPQPLFAQGITKDEALEAALGCYRHIEKIFSELEDIRPFEILRSARDKANYLLIKEARIIAMTSTHAAMRRHEIAELGFRYDNVVMEEAAQVTEIENFIPLALQKPKDGKLPLQRIVLCGDHLQNSPVIENLAFRQYANLEQSLFLRLVRLGVPTIMLDQQGRARPSIAGLYSWRYPNLGNLPSVETQLEFRTANAGFAFDYQFIDVPDYKGKGEMQPTPHFIQNLGEAEYVVALYMYMRLLGYPADKVTILTTYAGQRALIRDVLNHRCKGNRLFGLPRTVSTVDRYQGEQNDYVLLSLVRTNRVGYLRDIRRLTVALSRARLGLYIFGRRAVFETCYELTEAFDKLFARPTKLSLVTDELHSTTRLLNDNIPKDRVAEMENVEHLGKYVYQMTQAKVKALKENGGMLPPVEEKAALDDEMEDDAEGLLADADVDDAPELDEI